MKVSRMGAGILTALKVKYSHAKQNKPVCFHSKVEDENYDNV